jgi:hypothetical protein
MKGFDQTCIRFVPYTGQQTNYIAIGSPIGGLVLSQFYNTSDHLCLIDLIGLLSFSSCSSYVGRQGGKQWVLLNTRGQNSYKFYQQIKPILHSRVSASWSHST